MAHVTTNKDKIVARVRRIAGQVAAVERSVLADAECADTLHLVAAVRGAVAGLMDELVEDHLHAHVAAAGVTDAERAAAAAELAKLLRRHFR
ncbi:MULTISPECIES: metal/formaldehyde-sensitive transcriptional repressor [Sphingomonas]|uniref:DNA-binding transcriptional regulator, FrmR family n=1 Tax=Sphingomonas carotinifaciens TaxID=1166323 RepID=A0A1G7IW41_9SPHN|nr:MULTISPECIES: metal/formaldehyde-sensitive transcriptional repressor [Sphingomonas]MBB4084728.1 DNA-binding FrmR family transcriptional regulator [Sphingomonas carotinifaciens]MWC44115.1 metal-sensing transcriptional repressor [Sphingomonas carotinifaciens]SDF16529.1 DNA-binding transcriptional regulator, FrmR family [Sphingomonas carotinifaciens]